jgi:O-antigen ligase
LSLYVFFLLAQLALTQTRSAWIACLVVFIGYGLLHKRRYLLYIAGVVLICLFIPAIQQRLLDLGSDNQIVGYQDKLNSFAWRVALWESALSWMEPSRYLLGYGIGAFREYAPTYFARSQGFKWDAHNVYVQWFFDVGFLGLASYLWIHFRTLQSLRPLVVIDRQAAFTTSALIVSYLLMSLSDNMMYYLAFNWYYWFAVGASSALVLARKSVPVALQGTTVRTPSRQRAET